MSNPTVVIFTYFSVISVTTFIENAIDIYRIWNSLKSFDVTSLLSVTVFSSIHIKYTHSWFLLNTHTHIQTLLNHIHLVEGGFYFYKTLCFVLRNDDQKRVVNDFEVIPISMDFCQTIPFGIKLRISLKLEMILYKF